MSARRAPPYRRRRLTALGALAVVVLVLMVLVTSGGQPSHVHRGTVAARRHVRVRATTRAPSTPALSLAGIPVGRWTSLPDSPTARGEVSAARVANTAYVVGGFDAGGHTSSQVQRLDLATGRWSAVAPMPVALNHMNSIGYRGRLYVLGGYSQPSDTSAGAVRGFWRYDPASGRWQAMPEAPIPRAAAGAAVLGHRLYVAGGRNDTTTELSSVEIFDFDTGRWSPGPPLIHAREHVAAVAAGGAVWVLGGRALGQGSFTYVERYVPGAGAWQSMTSMPVARSGFQAASVGRSIVAVGGENGASMVPEVDRLSLRTDHWSRLADLPVARHGLGLVADGPLVFAIDGGPQPGLTMSRVVERLRVG